MSEEVKQETPVVEMPKKPDALKNELVYQNIVINVADKKGLMTSITDANGYLLNIDVLPFDSISRVRYNAIRGELTIIYRETIGNIHEEPTQSKNSKGMPIGGVRYAVEGRIECFSHVISDREEIKAFLEAYTGSIHWFKGFEAHDAAKAKLAEMMEKKKAEEAERKAEKESK